MIMRNTIMSPKQIIGTISRLYLVDARVKCNIEHVLNKFILKTAAYERLYK